MGERGWAGGRITVCLWEAAEGFPWKPRLARRMACIDPAEGQKSVVFMGLRPGRYAVTAFADRRGKGRLSRNLIGRPTVPVFLAGSRPWLRNMRFEDYAERITQSTILDLKLAPAKGSFGGTKNGDKNDIHNHRPRQNAVIARSDPTAAAPAHRR
ncbi:MAG: hypothetical protein CVT79_09620 [Alphaproteobacteria bacterium HGW-Alphaproteobacteria-18]|nr:MAG: hypothetical protein CVT79_09620 [Alphaproteobacteria bacterium HGW-Alphaproteobacteria-18]